MKLKQLLSKKRNTLPVLGVVFSHLFFNPVVIQAQVQQHRWYLDDTEIDFTKSTPQVNQGLPGYSPLPSSPNEVFNGITNAYGSMLFYTDSRHVYNKHENAVSGVQGFNNIQPEVNIVPKPGSPCRYYILCSDTLAPKTSRIYWTELDVTQSFFEVNSGPVDAGFGSTNMAVSKPRNQGNSFYVYYILDDNIW